MKKFTVDIIIPTFRPGEKFNKLMQMIQEQTYPIERILIMNTEASGLLGNVYENLPRVEIYHLTQEEFDHGGTRDRAAMMSDAELMLFMTQDAVPADEFLVERLSEAFHRPEVEAAYARQLPDERCNTIERFTRNFNYPNESSIKSKSDLHIYGIKTFFCSNVCAMYRKAAYEKLGGFEKQTIFNEDMIFAGNLIRHGGSIAYIAEAKVIHSHNYGFIKQLQRNFDLAVSQADHPEIFSMAKSEGEGIRLVMKTGKCLLEAGKPWLIPKLVVESGFKFLGYLLGKHYKRLPKWLIMKLTMSKAYWKSRR